MPFNTALITGASSGIGKEFALALGAKRTWNLILVARQLEKLQQTRGSIYRLWGVVDGKPSEHGFPEVEVLDTDLTSEQDLTKMVQYLKDKGVTIDLLINNAGFSYLDFFSNSDPKQNIQLINIHCNAPVYLCRAFLPEMINKKSGTIINVCSRRGFAPVPFLNCYSATKAFLIHFSVALAEEVKESGVKVLALCPGSTNTPANLYQRSQKGLFAPKSPEDVVTLTLAALERNQSIYIVGLTNRIIFSLLRIIPMSLAARIQKALLISHVHAARKNLQNNTRN